jgi:hypothetical protein
MQSLNAKAVCKYTFGYINENYQVIWAQRHGANAFSPI